jgi:hypothetical protein
VALHKEFWTRQPHPVSQRSTSFPDLAIVDTEDDELLSMHGDIKSLFQKMSCLRCEDSGDRKMHEKLKHRFASQQ